MSCDALGRVTSIVSPGDHGQPYDAIRLPHRVTNISYNYARPRAKRTRRGSDLCGTRGWLWSQARRIQQAATSGQWVLSGFNRLDSRGKVAFTAYPTLENSADLPSVNDGRDGTSTLRDALARETYTRYPDGAETRIDYAPLSVTNYDENDNDQSSPHKNTPTTHNQDGLGRLVSVIEREEPGRLRPVPTRITQWEVSFRLWMHWATHGRTATMVGRAASRLMTPTAAIGN